MDAKITNSNENKANPVNYSTQGFTGDPEYLRGLNDKYEDFIRNKYKGKVLTIDVDNLDYKNRPEDFKFITDKIDSILFGLFDLNDL